MADFPSLLSALSGTDPNNLLQAQQILDNLQKTNPAGFIQGCIQCFGHPNEHIRALAVTSTVGVVRTAVTESLKVQGTTVQAQPPPPFTEGLVQGISQFFPMETAGTVLRAYSDLIPHVMALSRRHSLREWREVEQTIQQWLSSEETAERQETALQILGYVFEDDTASEAKDAAIAEKYMNAFTFHVTNGMTQGRPAISVAAVGAGVALLVATVPAVANQHCVRLVVAAINMLKTVYCSPDPDCVQSAIDVLSSIFQLFQDIPRQFQSFIGPLMVELIGLLGQASKANPKATQTLLALIDGLLDRFPKAVRRTMPQFAQQFFTPILPMLAFQSMSEAEFDNIFVEDMALQASVTDNAQLYESLTDIITNVSSKLGSPAFSFMCDTVVPYLSKPQSPERLAALRFIHAAVIGLQDSLSFENLQSIKDVVINCAQDQLVFIRHAVTLVIISLVAVQNTQFVMTNRDGLIRFIMDTVKAERSPRVAAGYMTVLSLLIQASDVGFVEKCLDELLTFTVSLLTPNMSSILKQRALKLLSTVAPIVGNMIRPFYQSIMSHLNALMAGIFVQNFQIDRLDPVPGMLINAATEVGAAAGPAYFMADAQQLLQNVMRAHSAFNQLDLGGQNMTNGTTVQYDILSFCCNAYTNIVVTIKEQFMPCLQTVVQMLMDYIFRQRELVVRLPINDAKRLEAIGRLDIETIVVDSNNNEIALCFMLGAASDVSACMLTIARVCYYAGEQAYAIACQSLERFRTVPQAWQDVSACCEMVEATYTHAFKLGRVNEQYQSLDWIIQMVLNDDDMSQATENLLLIFGFVHHPDTGGIAICMRYADKVAAAYINTLQNILRDIQDDDNVDCADNLTLDDQRNDVAVSRDTQDEISDAATACAEFLGTVFKNMGIENGLVFADRFGQQIRLWLQATGSPGQFNGGVYALSVLLRYAYEARANDIRVLLEGYNVTKRAVDILNSENYPGHMLVTCAYCLGFIAKHGLLGDQLVPVFNCFVARLRRPDATSPQLVRVTDNVINAYIRLMETCEAQLVQATNSTPAQLWSIVMAALPPRSDVLEAEDCLNFLIDVVNNPGNHSQAIYAPEIAPLLLNGIYRTGVLQIYSDPAVQEGQSKAAARTLAQRMPDCVNAFVATLKDHERAAFQVFLNNQSTRSVQMISASNEGDASQPAEEAAAARQASRSIS